MKISNPISGAILTGLFGAADVAVGAAVRQNDVHDEAMTMLVGGVITGAMAGVVGCMIPSARNVPVQIKLAIGILNVGLIVAAGLTAPLMGELILDNDTKWGRVIVDDLIGGAILLGGTIALVSPCALLACCCGVSAVTNEYVTNKVSGFFGITPEPSNTQTTVNRSFSV